jgi:DHA1 family bicyclomycin/chloramphenicol resistance-like MFS transporter
VSNRFDNGRAAVAAWLHVRSSGEPTPAYRPTVKYVLLLGAMTTLPAISSDIYLPSLPDVARDLHTSATAVQLTISAMMVGGSIGQLVIGPLTDRYGRRRPAMVGIGLHVLTSLLCAIAPSIVPLVAARTLQGFFNAAGTVAAMAVIRDRFVGAEASRLLSRLMLVIGVAPLFAPSVGGLIAGQAGWRAVFWALALVGVALLILVWRRLPETLPLERRRDGGLRTALSGYRSLLSDRHFVALAVLPGLGQCVLMSYVVGSPFALREGFGLSANQFALLFAANGVALIGGAQVNAALVRRVAPVRILRASLPTSLTLTVALLLVVHLLPHSLIALLVVLWLLMGMINFVPPNASALALSRHGEMAGTAAAVIGSLQAGIAGTVSPLVGVLGGNAVAMATVMVAAASAGLAVLALATPAYRRGGGWSSL